MLPDDGRWYRVGLRISRRISIFNSNSSEMDSNAIERKRNRRRECKVAERRDKNGPSMHVKIRSHDGVRIRKCNSTKVTKKDKRECQFDI